MRISEMQAERNLLRHAEFQLNRFRAREPENADIVAAHEAARAAYKAFDAAVRKASVPEREKARARRVMDHPTIEEARKGCNGCCATCMFAEVLDGDVAEALGIDGIATTYCLA